MNIFVRWIRFNAVGAMGMAVQLGALALLSRCDEDIICWLRQRRWSWRCCTTLPGI